MQLQAVEQKIKNFCAYIYIYMWICKNFKFRGEKSLPILIAAST